jgi:hypothetical protein
MAKTPDWDPEKDEFYKERRSYAKSSNKSAQRRTVKGAMTVTKNAAELSELRRDAKQKTQNKQWREMPAGKLGPYPGGKAKFSKDEKSLRKEEGRTKSANARLAKLKEMAGK